jgi:hypothetical protein
MVTQHSATCGGQSDTFYNRQPIQANHSQMVKFSDRSNGDYLDVMKRIRRWVDEAPKIVMGRFTPQGLQPKRL